MSSHKYLNLFSATFLCLVWNANLPLAAQNQEQLDIDPQIIQDSPVLQRWREKVPNVLEDIRNDPSFRTRWRFGYSHYSSGIDRGGFNLGVEDIFIDRTGLTISANYQGSFDGDRASAGGDLHYYVLPLGGYVNIAPVLGYRYFKNDRFSTDGVNLGAKLIFILSRTGAADLSITQSFISPGGKEEVSITNFSVGLALTSQLRLSTEIEKQNSPEDKDNRLGIGLEWMFPN